MSTATADIGLIGLAVMGENLVLNMESRGYTCAVFNRTTEKVDAFVKPELHCPTPAQGFDQQHGYWHVPP